ncbi:MAG: P-loop NTPase fold protein, partial [candidate division Zixibacteria bacterium]|nr:P-loop NTPase fold protein [candidate division Zixibacteria bacterium]
RSEQDQQRAEVIDFNAWRYSKSNAVWAAFLGVIVKGIEDSLGFWKKISFRLFVTRKAHPLRLVGWIAGVIVFGFILYGKVPTIIDHFTSDQTVQGDQLRQIITVVEDNPPNDTTATLYVKEPKTENDSLIDFESIGVKNAMTVVTGLITVISTIWGWFWPLSRGVLGKVKKGGRDILPQAQEDVIQYLSIVSQWLALQTKPTEESEDQPPTSSLSTDRFVVFIDDIDRVQPGKVLLLMEAIKLFMDTERFVFILAMDTRVVRFAIGEHYKFMCKTVKDREEMGRFYLEKMIQVPFHLPALTAVKRRQLIDSVISKYVVEEMSEPEPVPVSETIDLPAKPAPYVAEPTAEPIAETAAPPSAERPAPARKAAPSPEAELSDEIDQPGPIEAVRMKITPTEYSVINNIMDTDGFNISPRLMKRFINIYMMARHILIMERAGQVGTGTGYVPPSSFAKWLAISVLHPFESAALVRWLSGRGWESPFATTGIDPNLVFDDKGEFCYQVKKKPSKTAERGTLNQKPFDDLSIRELHRFGRLLLQLDLDWIAVSRNIHITNCFNLVLE